MSRSSLRMKHYRPMSADFTKVSTLSSVFGLNGGQDGGSGDKTGGANANRVKLINYKRSDDLNNAYCSVQQQPRVPSPIAEQTLGLAPIARLNDDLTSNCNEPIGDDDEVCNGINNNPRLRRSSLPLHHPQQQLKERSLSGSLEVNVAPRAAAAAEKEEAFWGSDLEEELLNETSNTEFESFSDDEQQQQPQHKVKAKSKRVQVRSALWRKEGDHRKPRPSRGGTAKLQDLPTPAIQQQPVFLQQQLFQQQQPFPWASGSLFQRPIPVDPNVISRQDCGFEFSVV